MTRSQQGLIALLAIILWLVLFKLDGYTQQICATGTCQQVVSVNQIRSKVVVPQFSIQQFAVPVGVPVSPIAQTFYQPGVVSQRQYTQNHTQLQTPAAESEEDRFIRKLAKAIALANDPKFRAAVIEEQKPTAANVIKNNCVKCHSGSAPKGGFDLSGPVAQYTDEQRELILARVFADDPEERMPPGKPMQPKDFRVLMQGLIKK